MASFEDSGLRPELLRILEEEEIERPTALQEAVIPTLRRGGNLVARASTGSGKTLAYGLGILDRLEPTPAEAEEGTPLRMLILSPTREEAQRAALSLAPYVQGAGLGLSVTGGAWGTGVEAAEVVAGTPGDVMEAVRGSDLKLESLQAVVLDGASALLGVGEWAATDALLDLLPRDAQKVVISASFPAEVEDLVERRVKRAIRYPVEPAIPEEGPPAPPEGEIGYVLVGRGQKREVLARQLTRKDAGDAPPILFLGSDERAAQLAEELSVRGFLVGAVDDAEADVAVVAADTIRAELLEESEEEIGQTISFDVPPDAATLRARHAGDDDAVVLVEPRELAHLHEIARQAKVRARPYPLPSDGGAARELATFREQVRRALGEEDLTAQLLVLDPLLEEYGPLEVAAAVTALLRRRAAAPAVAPSGSQPAPSQRRSVQAAPPTRPAMGAPLSGAPPAVWTRLYVGVGSRDEVRPGDLVGALAGEANIKGSQIGKIEIRDSFSIVEVQADVADLVIRSANGKTVKGRSLRVDYDRGTDRARRGPAGAPPRRATRKPPRGS